MNISYHTYAPRPIASYLIFTNIHSIAANRSDWLTQLENLAEGFRDMFAVINSYIQTPFLTINGNIYTVEFLLCANYKIRPIFCI